MGGEYKDFWSEYTRAVAKLKSFGIMMNDEMVFRKVAQSLRPADGQLPISLSSLKTSGGPASVGASGKLTIEMYETQRPISDQTDVYQLSQNPSSGEEELDLEDNTQEW